MARTSPNIYRSPCPICGRSPYEHCELCHRAHDYDARPILRATERFELRRRREKLGLSRERFGHSYGIYPGSLREWENGGRNPTDRSLTLWEEGLANAEKKETV